jgi:plastocyanin
VRRPRVGLALPSAGLLALVLATALWSGDTTTTNAASPPPTTTARLNGAIAMNSVAFSPRATTVAVGQTVTWVNEDRVPHDVVATSGATFHSETFRQGETFKFRATRPGTIAYVCSLHQGMNGTLTVTR